MSESGLSTSAAMLFERNDAQVLEAFRRGEFDYVDAIGEVSEADFFRVITERKILDKLAQSYPSPRERHDVPLWVYMASNLPSRVLGYAGDATPAVAVDTRQAAPAAGRVVKGIGVPVGLGLLLFLAALILFGYWLWTSRRPAKAAVFNSDEQATLAGHKGPALLAVLKSGLTAQDRVPALHWTPSSLPSSVRDPRSLGAFSSSTVV